MAKKDTHPLPEPIDMDLGDNPGHVHFDTFEEVLTWATTQDSWSKEFSDRNTYRIFRELIDRQIAPAQNIHSLATEAMNGNIAEAEAFEKIAGHLRSFANYEAIHQSSLMGKFIDGFENSHWGMCGALMAVIGCSSPQESIASNISEPYSTEFIEGAVKMAAAFPNHREGNTAFIRAKIHTLYTEEQKKADERETSYKNLCGQHETAIEALTSKHEESLSQLSFTTQQYNEYMRLKSPAQYWKERGKSSATQGWTMMGLFVLMATIGIVLMLFGLPHVFENLTSKANNIGIAALGILPATAAIVLTVLALLFKATMSLMRDSTTANERHTMIMTYIAFSGDEKNPMDEQHRRHVLDRLFTPTSEDSKTKDDPYPYLEALRKLRNG